jgi:hypothetical protein
MLWMLVLWLSVLLGAGLVVLWGLALEYNKTKTKGR